MSLLIKKNNYGLRVTCHKCQRDYYHHNVTKCKHHNIQRYKSIVYFGSSTKVMLHKTKKHDEALIAAINFKKEVKSGALITNLVDSDDESPEVWSIYFAANKFLNFKNGVNVPIQLKEDLSKKRLKAITRYVRQFVEVMNSNGIDPKTILFSSLNENHISIWVSFIRENYSKGSWNTPLGVMKMWTNFMIERKKVKMFNYFKDVKSVMVENNVEIIRQEEFEKVCEAVGVVNPYRYLNGNTTKRKNVYKPYLVEAYRLALMTGLRREEYLTLTWDDIYEDKEGFMIITDNLKVERLTKSKHPKKHVPVHEQLKSLLLSLDWESNKGSNKFIIAPSRTTSVETMMDYCSRSFSHYYNEVFPNRPIKRLNVLRETYITYLTRSTDKDVVYFTSHSGMKVLENHYLDKRVLAKGRGMKIFGK